jgi:hypothetical protein
LPPYVTIRSDEGGFEHSTTGKLLLDVFGTRGAVLTSATLNGLAVSSRQGQTQTQLEKSSESGLPVWRLPVETPPGRAQVVVLNLSEPIVAGSARAPEQPQDIALTRQIALPTCSQAE